MNFVLQINMRMNSLEHVFYMIAFRFTWHLQNVSSVSKIKDDQQFRDTFTYVLELNW